MVGTNLMEFSSSWALNPPKKCPKCGAKVKTFYINLNLDQVVMCESLSCNWPFKGTNGSIIPGKVEEVKQEVGKQVKEELVEVNQNDKEVAVCGNSKEKKKKKREKRGKETFDREYARAGHLVGTLKNKVEKTNKKMEKLGRKKGEFAPLVSGGEQWFDVLSDPLKSGEGPMTHSAAHSSGRSVGVRKAEASRLVALKEMWLGRRMNTREWKRCLKTSTLGLRQKTATRMKQSPGRRARRRKSLIIAQRKQISTSFLTRPLMASIQKAS